MRNNDIDMQDPGIWWSPQSLTMYRLNSTVGLVGLTVDGRIMFRDELPVDAVELVRLDAVNVALEAQAARSRYAATQVGAHWTAEVDKLYAAARNGMGVPVPGVADSGGADETPVRRPRWSRIVDHLMLVAFPCGIAVVAMIVGDFDKVVAVVGGCATGLMAAMLARWSVRK
ncbi:hypothetical protein SEA_BETTERKATZ_54 [Gordonia phage BetterKatz]|uniref:Uncharacterized protein n=1 Tax=Gordonia phage BetterKatz TaxID=1821551 RepID=A0A142KC56_9CAUD|nr:hypothetical protein BJD67_gp54 [Gordonia phage BetterKatz]AMS03689.1 hypothetical protein SEA_BETTERKATZ_54 [Gordonia phage BetterKatz]